MQFPKDIFESRIETNMRAADILKVYNDLRPGNQVADLNGVDAKQWFLNYAGNRFEFIANDEGIITGLFLRND